MAKGKKMEEPIKAEIVEPVEKAPRHQRGRRRNGSIFWGFAFIFFGALLLLDNLNIISVHFDNLWQLWPLFIIGAGVSMLSIRGWLGAILSFVLVASIGTLVYFVAVDNPYYSPVTAVEGQQSDVDGSAVIQTEKELDLTVRTGAVEFNVASNPTQTGFSATLLSRQSVLNQSSNDSRDGIRYVTIQTDTNKSWWMGMGMMNSRLSLELTQQLPLSLHINTGASTITGDLSAAQLKTLTIDAGATTIDFRLGTNQAKQDVSVNAGASHVTISVPKGAGVRIETQDGLNHTDFEDVNKLSNGVYESNGFVTAEKQITIHAKLGVTNFELKRY